MGCKYSMFSKMKWLDKQLERNSKSEGRNQYSDGYYQRFVEIRNEQENLTVTDYTYTQSSIYMFGSGPELGYYMANIHYDMFVEDTKEILEAEKRTIDFLIKSDPNVLRQSSTLKQFILGDIRLHIIDRNNHNLPWNQTDVVLIEHYGNEYEKEIARMYQEIYPNRPIISRIELQFFDKTKRTYKNYIFDTVDQFNLFVAPLSKDGKVLEKQGALKKYKKFSCEEIENIFTQIYQLARTYNSICDYRKKSDKKYVRIRYFDCSYYFSQSQYSGERLLRFKEFLIKMVGKNFI